MKLLNISQYKPLLYRTSKQHKCPYQFRFIAGASKSYTKQLAIGISLALKWIKQKWTGISYHWSVDNSYELLNNTLDINTARSIKTFDLSPLNTNVPLDVIYDNFMNYSYQNFYK